MRTAPSSNDASVWVEIRHPFHPLKGQRFALLRHHLVTGVDTLILRCAEHGNFAVPRDWTDWAIPNAYGLTDRALRRLELDSLCELVALIELLASRRRGGLAK